MPSCSARCRRAAARDAAPRVSPVSRPARGPLEVRLRSLQAATHLFSRPPHPSPLTPHPSPLAPRPSPLASPRASRLARLARVTPDAPREPRARHRAQRASRDAIPAARAAGNHLERLDADRHQGGAAGVPRSPPAHARRGHAGRSRARRRFVIARAPRPAPSAARAVRQARGRSPRPSGNPTRSSARPSNAAPPRSRRIA